MCIYQYIYIHIYTYWYTIIYIYLTKTRKGLNSGVSCNWMVDKPFKTRCIWANSPVNTSGVPAMAVTRYLIWSLKPTMSSWDLHLTWTLGSFWVNSCPRNPPNSPLTSPTAHFAACPGLRARKNQHIGPVDSKNQRNSKMFMSCYVPFSRSQSIEHIFLNHFWGIQVRLLKVKQE